MNWKHPDINVRKVLKKRYILDQIDNFANQELQQIDEIQEKLKENIQRWATQDDEPHSVDAFVILKDRRLKTLKQREELEKAKEV